MPKVRSSNVLAGSGAAIPASPAGGTVEGVSQSQDDRAMAPWPQIDRSPLVIGQGLSLQYIANVFRLCLIGYRQQYVDLLDELLEKDGHLFSVTQKRVLAVACAKMEFTPADVKTDEEEKLALEVCEFVEAQVRAIPNIVQHLAWLCWALYYSVGALENHWEKRGNEWVLARLSNVHSRRLAYPDHGAWDLYIWDQGNVLGSFITGFVQPRTNGIYGLRIADYPGKFVVHSAQVRGDYPTRDGLGRQVATWVALKLIATRGAAQYLERFAKPWPEATYTTSDDVNKPRPATTGDIEAAKAALNALGQGSLSSYTHPDTIKLSLLSDGGSGKPKLTFKEWIEICNSEHSKVVIGGTLTTEVGSSGGNRSLGNTQKKSEVTLEQYDALNVAETLKRDVLRWIVKLNFGDQALCLTPTLRLHVEDEATPEEVIARATAFAAFSPDVDTDAVAEEAGIPLVDPNDAKARRMTPSALTDPSLTSPEFQKRVALLPKPEPEPLPDAGEDPNAAPTDKPGDKPTTEDPAPKPAH